MIKRHKFFLIFIFTVCCSFAFGNDSTSDTNEKMKFQFQFTKLNMYKIMHYSSWGTSGTIGMVNMFAQVGNAVSISRDIQSLSNDLSSYTTSFTSILNNFATYYPAITFGGHFLLWGISCIPAAGGLIYGSFLISGAIGLSVLNILLPDLLFSSTSNQTIDDYNNRLQSIRDRVLDPTALYAVGAVSFLFGVAELVMFLLYRREVRRTKYPYIHKIFTFKNNALVIKLDV